MAGGEENGSGVVIFRARLEAEVSEIGRPGGQGGGNGPFLREGEMGEKTALFRDVVNGEEFRRARPERGARRLKRPGE